jgi:tRNA threonylcarbamoyladenosine biosynthesis protein TsaB
MITLAIDASTYRGSVAVLDDSRVLVEESAAMKGRDRELLMPAVARALRESGIGFGNVGRVVCGAGPGSFTSLRIAASIAKGIAVGRGIPLVPISSLALIVAGNVKDGPRGARRYMAVMDALRGESYVADYNHEAGEVRSADDFRLVSNADVPLLAERSGARIVGPDQAYNWYPRAGGVALLMRTIATIGPVNLAQWEPIYGRMAEAQAKWEKAHGRALPT